jgi:hypothetical protein
MLSSRMSLAQNSLPDERGSDLREPLRSPRLCVILNMLSPSPHCSSMHRPRLPDVTGEPRRASRRTPPATSASRRNRKMQPFVYFVRPNSSRINTSANSSFFTKSLIMNDLKSNRISKRANKSSIINTSGHYGCKSSRINTSRNHPGGGGVCATCSRIARRAEASAKAGHSLAAP